MTSINQASELRAKIWKIANEVRGSVDGWDFKQFVLGTLFYRFISENFTDYIEGGDESVDYASLSDDVITPEIKDDAIKTKGYFIYPSQLFRNVAKTANTNSNLNTDLAAIFTAIESSANGYPSEQDIKGLFADFDTTSSRLGNTVENKNSRLAAVLKGVEELNFENIENFEDNQIDLFGDAYEFLISNYAANAGKSGGEFFTPQQVSKLIAQLAMHKQTTVNKIYDPAAGSGSLLLQAKKHFDNHIIEEGFYGQEVNHTTYNLARMNMFLHNINYDKFHIVLGNTLTNPQLGDEKPFDAIVSNPPYSVKWIGSDDPTMINDDRFAPAGVLAPKSKADFAFVLHALSYLSSKGRAALVCFPGIFYRGGAEQKIRKYLVDNNFVETIISLAPNLFYGTPIAVNIMVLSKSKTETKTQFIDASGENFFKKATNNNIMTDAHIESIIEMFNSKEEVPHLTTTIDNKNIAKNNYDLSVSSYVKPKDTSIKIDIDSLNSATSNNVTKINALRANINELINEIGSNGNSYLMDKILDGVEIIWKPLGEITDYEQPTKYRVSSTEYKDDYKTPVLTAGKTFILGFTDENKGIYKGSENPVIIFDDFTTANKWVDFDFKVKSSAMKLITSKDESKTLLKYIYYWLNTLPSGLVEGDHKRQWISKYAHKKIPIPCPDNKEKSIEVQKTIVELLDNFTKLSAELSAELSNREKQYEYYRDLLLTFPKEV